MMLLSYVATLLGLTILHVSALWPQPSQYQHGNKTLWLTTGVQVDYKAPSRWWQAAWGFNALQSVLSIFQQDVPRGNNIPLTNDDILELATRRMKDRLKYSSFVPWKFHPRGTIFEPSENTQSQQVSFISIEVNKELRGPDGSSLDREWYSLRITEDDAVLVTAVHPHGALRALETLTQLFYEHSKGGMYTSFAPLVIEDSPAFSHRGLNLDISRNWISPSDVKRTIDIMSSSKLNYLHLHAADAQSWPLEIPSMPALAEKGAYHLSLIWSVEDLKSVQAHGALLGIEVYLEIDIPGHTSSIGHAFPDFITAFEESDWQKYSLEPPSGQLLLNSSAASAILQTVMNDLLPRVSRFTSLFHTGGDEVNEAAYALDPTVRSSSRAVLKPLLQNFLSKVHKTILSREMTPIVWEEMILDWNLTLHPRTIIQTWRNPKATAQVVETGHRAIFGDHEHWYLDCGLGSWLDPRKDGSPSKIKPPYLDYCEPYKNWREVYTYDPLTEIKPEHNHLVIGGEVHLWAEMTDESNLDSMLWPRAAAAAEVMWSGPKGVSSLDEGVTRRLADWRERVVGGSVPIGMVQMTWCLMHEGGCTS